MNSLLPGLLALSLTITLSCASASWSADDFDCDFAHGICNYTLPQSEGVAIKHDDSSNRNYITFDEDNNNGYLTSPELGANGTFCFQYSYFFNATSPAYFNFIQHSVKNGVIHSETVRLTGDALGWYDAAWQPYVWKYSSVIDIHVYRSNLSDSIGLTGFHGTPGDCRAAILE
ncbi:hypothetical protein HDE_05988 [Halotydeus destructor]|nr:hypothetical protein HDE_05988 [Halotydeus destructor]